MKYAPLGSIQYRIIRLINDKLRYTTDLTYHKIQIKQFNKEISEVPEDILYNIEFISKKIKLERFGYYDSTSIFTLAHSALAMMIMYRKIINPLTICGLKCFDLINNYNLVTFSKLSLLFKNKNKEYFLLKSYIYPMGNITKSKKHYPKIHQTIRVIMEKVKDKELISVKNILTLNDLTGIIPPNNELWDFNITSNKISKYIYEIKNKNYSKYDKFRFAREILNNYESNSKRV